MKLLASASLFLAFLSPVLSGEPKPNVILFLVDDMGLMDTSVPMLADQNGKPKRHPLNDWYRTPNMERLAKQGIRFSQFYAQSVCSPTRASIMTGQNSARHRVTQFISPEKRNAGPKGWRWEGLTSKDVTLPAQLRKEGYHTIFSGKAHFAPVGFEGEDPTNLGFDVNIAGCSFGQPGSYFGEDGYGNLNPKRKKRAVPGLEKYHKTDTFLSEAITLEAKAAINQSLKKQKPFFLYMSHYAVHSPFNSDLRFANNYKDSDKPKNAQAYATLIEGIDKSLGDLMDHVASKGVAENTLVLFVGDNGSDAPLGPVHGYSSSVPLRGKKGTCYEGGMRVPFIAGWAKPGKKNAYPIARGILHNEQIGTVMDIYATILETTGAKNPKEHVVDGVSLIKQLSGKENPDRPDHFMCHFPHSHRSSHFTALRKGDWKLIYRYKGKAKYELYDLQNDPYEKTNLAESKTDRLKEMTKAMIARLEKEDALYPADGEKALKPVLP
ncbi:MAG: N-acetylgalactosamine-6-sulfatase [Opitutae bacterium]|nr:N-acetylgalactosamine-6-sulfatase [Opitutae bacterium]